VPLSVRDYGVAVRLLEPAELHGAVSPGDLEVRFGCIGRLWDSIVGLYHNGGQAWRAGRQAGRQHTKRNIHLRFRIPVGYVKSWMCTSTSVALWRGLQGATLRHHVMLPSLDI
jgi:hypothetical protein